MGRYKTLINNTLVFGISNFTAKLLVFIMLPFYTAVLSKEEFGISDMLLTTAGLLSPILTLGIAEASLRFALDKSKDIKQVFSISAKILILGIVVLLILSPILSRLEIIGSYYVYFLFLYATSVVNTFLSLFARGIQKVKLVGLAGVASSFTAVGVNILLLFIFHWGIKGYLLSYILAHTVSGIILLFGGGMLKYFSRKHSRSLTIEMLSFSAPLIPNRLCWWANDSSNRYILNYFCGVGAVGIYSAATKLPVIIEVFRSIFVEAWQISAITEYETKDSDVFFLNIYKVYNVFVIMSCAILIMMSKVLAVILYSSDFIEAWNYTPLLFLSSLFSALISFYSPLYLAHKKTKSLLFFTLSGSVVTILINLFLVPYIGIYGAALGMVISYCLMFVLMALDSRRFISLGSVQYKFYFSYFIVGIMSIVISFFKLDPFSIIPLTFFLLLLIINVKESIKILMILYTSITKRLR